MVKTEFQLTCGDRVSRNRNAVSDGREVMVESVSLVVKCILSTATSYTTGGGRGGDGGVRARWQQVSTRMVVEPLLYLNAKLYNLMAS